MNTKLAIIIALAAVFASTPAGAQPQVTNLRFGDQPPFLYVEELNTACADDKVPKAASGVWTCGDDATGVPLLALSDLGDLCAGLESPRRNAGDTANECVTFATGAHFAPAAGVATDHGTGAVTEGDLAAEDYGAFTCGAGADDCLLDAGSVTGVEIADGTVDGEDIASTYAGRSLTESAGSPDVLDADVELYERTACFALEDPDDADNFLFFRAERALTLTGVDCLVNAATSAVVTLQECDGNGGSCGTSESVTCGTTNTTESGGIDDAAIDAGDWMRLDIGTVSGTPGHVNFCVTYQLND